MILPSENSIRDGYKDPQATWTSIYTNYAAFGYNTRDVSEGERSQNLQRSAEAGVERAIGIDSRAYEWFGTMVKAMGEEKGLAYMRELAKQVGAAQRPDDSRATGCRRRIQRCLERLFADASSR